jgi:hypothetical protein
MELEDDDRRFLVHEVEGEPMDKEFYNNYDVWLHGPLESRLANEREGKGLGPPALLYHLRRLNLKGMLPEDRPPTTESKLRLMEDSKSSLGLWVMELKKNPEKILRMGDVPIPGDLWSSQDLLKQYDPDEKTRITAHAMTKELNRAGFKRAYNGLQIDTAAGQKRLFIIRNLEAHEKADLRQLRTHYDYSRGGLKPVKVEKPKKF